MQNLNLIDIIKNVISVTLKSKVSILIILEILIIIIGLIFSKLMDKKLVKKTCIVSSIMVLIFYLTNYLTTMATFINNVSSKLIEIIYFPTTLELVLIMICSITIMILTLVKSKNIILKVINTFVPFTISFLFLNIIEYINTNKIAFDEFSVFTEANITSLYECAMIVFIIWLVGLIIYKIDLHIINRLDDHITLPKKQEEMIELPRLKESKVL